MTLRRFLKMLAGLQAEWYVQPRGQIRKLDDNCCPVVAVARSVGIDAVNIHPFTTTTGLNLKPRIVKRILVAADNDPYLMNWRAKLLRRKLLRLCNLR